MQPSDYFPRVYLDEFRRLAKFQSPIEFRFDNDRIYSCRFTVNSVFEKLCTKATDCIIFKAGIDWIRDGPIFVKVTEGQYETLAHVDINLELKDFTMPFPAVMIVFPPGKHHKCALVCKHSPDVISIMLMSPNREYDINITMRHSEGDVIESTLGLYEPELESEKDILKSTARVALNMMLAMTNFGWIADYVLPKDVISDKRLAQMGGEKGEKAKERVRMAPQILNLDRSVLLRRGFSENLRAIDKKSGREMPFNRVRGHWKMQAYKNGRERIYIAPYVRREDKRPPEEGVITYHS